jgi:signal transduction histidine kinase
MQFSWPASSNLSISSQIKSEKALMSYMNGKLHCREESPDLFASPPSIGGATELELIQAEVVPVFDEATQTAAHLLESPICVVGLIEGDRQIFKAAFGLYRMGLMNELAISRQLPRDESFCADVVERRQAIAIANTTEDSATSQKQLVQKYGIHAYLGVPLLTSTGQCVGTLAVMELAPRSFSRREIELLELIARWCMSEYERIYLGRHSFSQDGWIPSEVSSTQPERLAGNVGSVGSASPSLDAVKADLLSQMAQDLRTPLTSILGMASMLNREFYGPLTSKQKEYVDVIHDSGQHLLTVLNEMLDLNKINHQPKTVNLASVDAEMLCQQALSTLEDGAKRRGQRIRITVGLEASDRLWMLDKDKFRQLIYHLVLSVIQAASSESEIRVHLAQRQEQLTINVWVVHPWLGEGLPHSDRLIRQLLQFKDDSGLTHVSHNPSLGLKPNDAMGVLENEEDGANPSTASDQANNPTRQNLQVLLSKQLVESHKGRITLQGSQESGYRYAIMIPRLSE